MLKRVYQKEFCSSRKLHKLTLYVYIYVRAMSTVLYAVTVTYRKRQVAVMA